MRYLTEPQAWRYLAAERERPDYVGAPYLCHAVLDLKEDGFLVIDTAVLMRSRVRNHLHLWLQDIAPGVRAPSAVYGIALPAEERQSARTLLCHFLALEAEQDGART